MGNGFGMSTCIQDKHFSFPKQGFKIVTTSAIQQTWMMHASFDNYMSCCVTFSVPSSNLGTVRNKLIACRPGQQILLELPWQTLILRNEFCYMSKLRRFAALVVTSTSILVLYD